MSQKEKLFADFQAPTAQEWIDKINADLKGADYQKKMVWRTNEGFAMQPFYRYEDIKDLSTINALPGEYPYVRGNKKDNNTWFVRQNISCDDPSEANKKALDVLNKGVDSLGLQIPAKKLSLEYLEQLLDGIDLTCIELNLGTCQGHTVSLAKLFVEYCNNKGYNKADIQGSVNFDPIQKILTKGKDKSALIGQAKELVDTLRDFNGMRCITVNADTLVNAGAYSYQELGYALAWGVQYMDALTDAGIDACLAAKKIKFNLGISGVYFMEIAKFRAARLLWANIIKQYTDCQEAAKMHVCATTSSYNLTLFDAYVNMLRTQTETMSAAIAGVDSIVVTPFDATYETPTDFAERIARNQQLLLKEECHFDRMVDVAGGSYFIEMLTKSLSEQAWKLFLEVEEQGGLLTLALQGKIQEVVNSTDKARHTGAAKRKEFMLGTNQFPNFNETSEGKRPVDAKPCCESCAPDFTTISAQRLASDFENLRLQVEAAPKQPVAFMLTIGNLAMRQARAQFSCNFLACAGYKVIDNLGFKSVEEGVEAAVKANADIVVICSSDEEYADYAVPAYQALAGRAMFVVAGAPECADTLKAAGIENFIHVRVDQLATLRDYTNKLLNKE